MVKKHANAQVTISSDAQRALFNDVCQRRHIEACGVLIGSNDEQGHWRVDKIHPLCNIFDLPVYFEFAPEDLLAVELSYQGQIVGVYHSHPTGFAKASKTDRNNMKRVNKEQQIPWVWLIIRGPFDENFIKHSQGHITDEFMIAYYHYARRDSSKLLSISLNQWRKHVWHLLKGLSKIAMEFPNQLSSNRFSLKLTRSRRRAQQGKIA